MVEFNDLAALEAALAGGEIACVLAEPALTNIGIVLPEPGLLGRRARGLHAHRHAADHRRDAHALGRPGRLHRGLGARSRTSSRSASRSAAASRSAPTASRPTVADADGGRRRRATTRTLVRPAALIPASAATSSSRCTCHAASARAARRGAALPTYDGARPASALDAPSPRRGGALGLDRGARDAGPRRGAGSPRGDARGAVDLPRRQRAGVAAPSSSTTISAPGMLCRTSQRADASGAACSARAARTCSGGWTTSRSKRTPPAVTRPSPSPNRSA